ncbi:hypothetical protein B0H66DRAFT_354928 [Apodospora peruviana]|uniref:Uncharacterized protein n=1 Tax=Apodospora peruviana TaxID=516989 RepID=A0AAE0HV84_9PEZI|nr:hypothetical protein B0H66DRAFT_354928 [Apodospora peruviana]
MGSSWLAGWPCRLLLDDGQLWARRSTGGVLLLFHLTFGSFFFLVDVLWRGGAFCHMASQPCLVLYKETQPRRCCLAFVSRCIPFRQSLLYSGMLVSPHQAAAAVRCLPRQQRFGVVRSIQASSFSHNSELSLLRDAAAAVFGEMFSLGADSVSGSRYLVSVDSGSIDDDEYGV